MKVYVEKTIYIPKTEQGRKVAKNLMQRLKEQGRYGGRNYASEMIHIIEVYWETVEEDA